MSSEAGLLDPEGRARGQAAQTAETIEDSYLRALYLVRIARGLQEAGQYERCTNELTHALEIAGMISRELPRARVLAETAVQFASAGQYERGIQVAQTITGYDAEALASIAFRYAEAGYHEEAMKTFSHALEVAQHIEDADRKVFVLLFISEHYAEAGQEDRSSEILSEVSLIAKRVSKGTAQIQAWARIANHYAEIGQSAQALLAAQNIEDGDKRAAALCEIALSQGVEESYSNDQARKLLHEIIMQTPLEKPS